MKSTKNIAATLPQPVKTKKGARLDMAVYVYPHGDGTKGNITSKGGQNVSFDSESEAIIGFASMLREARKGL